MSEFKWRRWKRLFICVTLLCLLFALVGCGKTPTDTDPTKEQSSEEMEPVSDPVSGEELVLQLIEETANSLFVSVFDISRFSEQDFLDYLAEKVVICRDRYGSLSQIQESLQVVTTGYAELENIYLGLDPAENWGENGLDHLWESLGAPQETEIVILLKAPSLSYLSEQDEVYLDQIDANLDAITAFAESKENVRVHYFSTSMWLVANDSNYVNRHIFNSDVTKRVFLLGLTDEGFQITRANYEACINYSRELVNNYINGAYDTEDLKDYTFVFLGDSIIGLWHESFSIPEVAGHFTNATVYNCALGGLSAGGEKRVLEVVEGLTTGTMKELLDKETLVTTVQKFYSDYEDRKKDKKLVFVINLGINDYFEGVSLEAYEEGIRQSMNLLKETYPKARFLLLSPNYISALEGGTAGMSGAELKLEEYAETMKGLALEKKTYFIDVYHDFAVNKDTAQFYLVDDVHLNENGLFLFGKMVGDFFNEEFAR